MAFSLKQFLLLILFAGFALAALLNSERTFMLEIVKLVTFATLVLMAYGVWTNIGETPRVIVPDLSCGAVSITCCSSSCSRLAGTSASKT